MYRYQNTATGFVKKPESTTLINQMLPMNDQDYYRNIGNQGIESSTNSISQQSLLTRDRRIYPIPTISERVNESESGVRINNFSHNTTNIKTCLIISAIFHFITILTFSSISTYLLLKKTIEIPIGTVILYSGNMLTLNSATYRWLLCDGSEVSRSTYKDLFDVIGITYELGNGLDTFNIPDFRARFPLGSNKSDNSQLFAAGQTSHRITLAEMPTHAHSTGTLEILSNGLHTHTYLDPGHDHGGYTESAGSSTGYYSPSWGSSYPGSGYGSHSHKTDSDTTGITIQTSGTHTHGIQGATAVNGSNQAIDMMPPYQTIHYIIRA